MKNKNIAFFLLVMMIFQIIFQASFMIYADEPVYSGISYGGDVIKNATYTDIKGWSNAEATIRLSALSIIRSYGSSRYYPKSFVSRQDALAAIVRGIGKQDEAVKAGEKIKKDNPDYSTVSSYIKGHIEVAKTLGLVLQEEYDSGSELTAAEEKVIENSVNAEAKKNWKMTKADKEKLLTKRKEEKAYSKYYGKTAAREEIAVWAARALKLEPSKADKTMTVYKYKDWKSINTLYLQMIESSIRKGIIKGAKAEEFRPKYGVSRNEFASILTGVEKVAQASGSLGYKSGIARVTDISKIDTAGANGTKKTIQITLQDSNKQKLTLKAGTDMTIPVIRSGRIGNETLIERDDVVEYTVTEDNHIILLQWKGIKEFKGTFLEYDPEKNTAHFNDEKGNAYNLKIDKNTKITAKNIPVDITKMYEGIAVDAFYTGTTLKSADLDMNPEAVNSRP